MFFVRDDVIANKPKLVEAFLKGWFETIAFMRKNKDEAVAIANAQDRAVIQASQVATNASGLVGEFGMDDIAKPTLAILQKDRQKNPALGYARDLLPMLSQLWPSASQRGVKWVLNAGGLNPLAAAQALQQLLNPAELRSAQITDLPALMEKFINSLKGTDYSAATPAHFGAWLRNNVTPRKYANILEYLKNPRTNILGMQVAFDIWNALHDLKINLQRQLDVQHPGQEGWVFAPPAGRAKLVSRTAGGFADPVRKAQAKG